MFRRNAVIFLLVVTALAPSFAAACAVSCAASHCEHAMGSADTPPCHGDQGSSDSQGQPADDGAGMGSMCAFAAAATISNNSNYVAPVLYALDVQAPPGVLVSFLILPADEPPKS
jgi:hypothetical protein